MEVQVQFSAEAEALEEGDGAALLGAHTPVSPDAPPQLREQARAGTARSTSLVSLAVVGADGSEAW